MSKNELNKSADECLTYIINTAHDIFKPIFIERKKQNMENENKNAVATYEQFNLNQETILELQIKQRHIDTKNGRQKVLDVKMYIDVYEDVEDAESGLVTKEFKGTYNRWLSLKFRKDAFDNIPQECKIHKIDDLSTGTLFVRGSAVKPPKEYYIEKVEKKEEEWTTRERLDFEENGIKPVVTKYPSVWIHKDGIVGFIPYTPSQERFTHHPHTQVQEHDNDDSTLVE